MGASRFSKRVDTRWLSPYCNDLWNSARIFGQLVGVQDFSGDHLQCVLLSLVAVGWSDIKNMWLTNCAEFEVMGASLKAGVLFALTVILGVTNYANGQLLSSLPKSLIVTATRAGGANLSGTGTIATSLSSIYTHVEANTRSKMPVSKRSLLSQGKRISGLACA